MTRASLTGARTRTASSLAARAGGKTTRHQLPPESEAHFQKAVVELATVLGYRVYHSWTSLHSAGGWPDLFLVRGPRAIAAELKSARGRLTDSQEMWLECLKQAGIEAYCWRPADMRQVAEILR